MTIHCVSVIFIMSLFVNGVSCIESVLVNEGDSVTLHTGLTDIQRHDLIEWRFGDKMDLIANINRPANTNSLYSGSDERFRDRVKLNDQNGDLTIANIRSEHTGVFQLDIFKEMTTTKSFNVTGVFGDTGGVKDVSVMEGDSVTLHTDVPDIQKYEKVLWLSEHENTTIAQIDRAAQIYVINETTDRTTVSKMHLDHQKGDLTIRNIGAAQSGLYQVHIISSTHTIHKRFNIIVSDGFISVSVIEGGSATLHTDVQGDHIIWWTSGNLLAAVDKKAHVLSVYDDVLHGRFRHRLELSWTGSLTISNIRSYDAGIYHLEISDSRHKLHKTFTVTVCERSLFSSVAAIVSLVLCLVIVFLIFGYCYLCCHRQNLKKNTLC